MQDKSKQIELINLFTNFLDEKGFFYDIKSLHKTNVSTEKVQIKCVLTFDGKSELSSNLKLHERKWNRLQNSIEEFLLLFQEVEEYRYEKSFEEKENSVCLYSFINSEENEVYFLFTSYRDDGKQRIRTMQAEFLFSEKLTEEDEKKINGLN